MPQIQNKRKEHTKQILNKTNVQNTFPAINNVNISACTSERTSDYVRGYISEYVSEHTSEYISGYISEKAAAARTAATAE